MSGTESYMGNGAGSEIHESSSQNSMPLAYSAHVTAPMYAPPMAMAPPPNSGTPAAINRPDTGVSGDFADATPLVQPSIATYQPDTGVSGDSATPVLQPIIVDNNVSTGEVIKRKRGRPKKYAPAGSIPPAVQPAAGQGFSGKGGRGRPRGYGRKQFASVTSGTAGVGFTPYIIAVKTGEDVLAKLMSFSQHKMQAVCILSANGVISNVTLRQASSSGGTVNYEGRFEILSLSGSFLLSESGGQRSRTGGLSVSLAGPDGRVLGGGVAGLLIAASPVQVIVGSFNVAGQQPTKSGHNEVYLAQEKLVSGASVGRSPPSRATLSESSGGPGSPLNHIAGGCNNSNS